MKTSADRPNVAAPSTLILLAQIALGGTLHAAEPPSVVASADDPLPYLDLHADAYRTPRAGEGFRADIFGNEVAVAPMARDSINAWLLGLQYNTPGPDERDFVPLGNVYFWRHPEESILMYGNVSGIFNEMFFGEQMPEWGPFQYVLSFRNFNSPTAVSEVIDGNDDEEEEMYTGIVRFGFGGGYRVNVDPGHNDNMFMANLIVEPSYLYFDDGSDTGRNVKLPQDTYEIGTRLEVKLDALERNVLWLAHEGYAAGANLMYGHRFNWDDWGRNGTEFRADDSRNYVKFDAYAVAAGGVPFVHSDRHRLLGSLHGGVGHHLDRFSATRIGGGANPMGWEFSSTAKPVLPGAAIWEYYPEHYLLGTAEYRWEPVFFTYLSVHGTAGWLDPVRNISGRFERKETLYGAVGGRLATGFFGKSMLVLDYTHNFNVVRDRERGGHEITLFVVKDF